MTAPVSGSTHGSPSIAGAGSVAPPPIGQLLHGVTLRPPVISWDGARHTGARLHHIDVAPAQNTPGVIGVVVQGDFIGVVASQHAQALQGRSRLNPNWATPAMPAEAAAAQPNSEPRLSHDAACAVNTEASSPATSHHEHVSHSYHWPAAAQQASAWAIAHRLNDTLVVWVCTRHPAALRQELAQLCSLPSESVTIIANGQLDVEGYDVAADAAVLAGFCERPVRVQQDSSAFSAQAIRIDVSATISRRGQKPNIASAIGHEPPVLQAEEAAASAVVSNLVIASSVAPGHRPSMAALLCGFETRHQVEQVVRIADYARHAQFKHVAHRAPLDSATLGLSAAAQVFAHESFFDEACELARHDPVQARLDTIRDRTGRDLIASVAARAQWQPKDERINNKPYEGRGFAYAHVIDQTQVPPREVWSAWVADISVDPITGAIDLTGLTVGHNTAAPQPSASPQIEDAIRGAASHWLQKTAGHDAWAAPEANYPLTEPAASIQLVQPGPVGLAWSAEAELPAAAAIANAIHDATGVRLRKPPFHADELKQKLALQENSQRNKRSAYALLGGMAAAVGSMLVAAMPWRAAIAPVANIDTSIYSAAAIERGRLVAAAGDCLVCHTAEGGAPNAGGLGLETPFGKIYTTNITPDKETGIGSWSYAAFERAMREGIHRDGRHLYPAFPYTAFTKISDPDMQSLYAYLMTQEPVRNVVQPTQLSFPYNARPLLAGWNLLFHKNEEFRPDATQSTLWNRGAYLVQGMGHCAACHSPRNALGAEKAGEHFLAGGFAEGWEAPALNTLSKAPIPWTEEELYRYLRTGYSPLHGVASGPMAPVVQSMAELPDQDVRAIAHYLGSLAAQPAPNAAPAALQAARLEEQSRSDERVLSLAGENLFQGACAVCHDAREGPPLFGARPSLALNTNLHSEHPDNAIQILLHGIDNPAMAELGYMPGFADSMNDEQLVTLLEYLRMRFAPDEPAWEGLSEKVRDLRD